MTKLQNWIKEYWKERRFLFGFYCGVIAYNVVLVIVILAYHWRFIK